MGDLEPLGVNFGPIYAQNLSLKYFTVTQKIYSYSRKAPSVVHVVSLVPRHPVNAHTSWRLSMIRLVFILNNILDSLVRLM